MCPVGVGKSGTKPSSQLNSQPDVAQLWALLIGVNDYKDTELTSLQYSAADCQELSKALEEATQAFEERQLFVHHDYAVETPTLGAIRASLKQISSKAKANDKVIFYFSGHGVLDPDTQQAILCLKDTTPDDLLGTGLAISELLQLLGECAAPVQFLWLDACHSGGVTWQQTLNNPTPQLIERLQERAARSQGFYALLSCDRAQQSWEFPEMGHGVFTYYLIRGLSGEAANQQGVIEADSLYRYVYHQTLQYIDKTNQQLRLINQQKRNRGESNLQPEYPLQTPKRIVEGVGELILGKMPQTKVSQYPRRALVIEANPQNQTSLELGKVLRGISQFEINYWLNTKMSQIEMKQGIQDCLRANEIALPETRQDENETALLYLKGEVEVDETGEVYFALGQENRLARSWLRQQLHRAQVAQQIIILDCIGTANLTEWIEELKLGTDYGQCLIVASSAQETPNRFTQAIVETLANADQQTGLSVASWIYQLKAHLTETTIELDLWLSGGRGVIEILPGHHNFPGSPSSSLDLGICPYVGLKAFREEDTAYFYGREQLTQKLIAELYHRSFIAVVGASGSGKSSVVQAGIIAQLKQGKQLPGSEQWRICNFRPGEHPLISLTEHLAESQEQQQQLEGLLYQGVEGFVRWLRAYPEPMVVLVVDQFEELFTIASAVERHQVLELLLGVINYARDRVKLLITLRVDFVTHCLEFSELAALLQQASFFVPPHLPEPEYRNAIIKPAESVGLQVEPALVEVLLQEIGTSAGQLPLLEFVLEQLWEYRDNGTLTLKAYQEKIGGLEGALEQKANAVYENLDADARDCAQWIFLALTQVGEGIADTSRRIRKGDLIVGKYPQALVERTLQALVEANLVVVDSDTINDLPTGESRGANRLSQAEEGTEFPVQANIEIAHEILIHHWSTLRWWLEQNRNRLQLQRQLQQAAKLWQDNEQNPDYLWQGVRLAQAEDIYIKYTEELSEPVQQFVEAAIAQRDAQQRQAQRRLRRAQAAAAAISLLGIVATVVGGFAYWQRQQTLVNQVKTLNASAQALSDSEQPLKALVTSLEAGEQLKQIAFHPNALPWETASTLQEMLHRSQARNLLTGHHQTVQAVDVSPEGNLIASASWDGTIKLWQSNGQLITTLDAHEGEVMDVRFHPDRNLIASASLDGTVRLWQRDGSLVQSIPTEQQAPNQVRFIPSGDRLLTAGQDGTLAIWNLDGTPHKRFVAHEQGITRISISQEGDWIATASQESSVVKIWGKDGTLVQTLTGYQDGVNDISFDANGELIAVASLSGGVQIWQRDGTLQAELPKHETVATTVAFTQDGNLISADQKGNIKSWSWQNNPHSPMATLSAHQGAIRDLSLFPKRQVMVSASDDKTLRTWQLPSSVQGHQGDIYSVQFAPQENLVASAGWDHKIRLWNAEKMPNQPPKTILEGHTKSIKALSFSPNGQRLASGSADQSIKIWHPHQQRRAVQTLNGHQGIVNSVDFSRDGEVLASASDDGTVRLWNANGDTEKTLSVHESGVSTVRFAPQGNILASGGYDGNVKLWQADGTVLQVLNAHQPAVSAIAFSSKGKILASAGWDNTIKLWRVSDGKLLHTLAGHSKGVTSLSFTPQGNVLASGSSDGTIKLWNPESGENLATLEGQPDQPLRSISFSADGQTLIAGGKQGILQQWQFDLASLHQTACDRVSNYLATSAEISQTQSSLCQD